MECGQWQMARKELLDWRMNGMEFFDTFDHTIIFFLCKTYESFIYI